MSNKVIEIACKGADSLSLDSLLEFQGNIKKLSKENYERLKRSLLKYGFSAPIFIWKNNGNNFIIDGHQRLKVLIGMQQEGHNIPPLPIVYIEANTEKEAKEKLLHITSQYGDFDIQGLDTFLEDAGIELDDLQIRLADGELLLNELIDDEDEKANEVPEIQERVITAVGDLWILGKHRLLCGDATKKEDIESLMEEEKADMVFTDPPYGINIVNINKAKGSIGFGGKLGFVGADRIVPVNAYYPIIGDETTETAKKHYLICLDMKCPMIFWGGNYMTDFLPLSPCWIIWDKRENIPSNNFADCEMAWTSFNKPSRIYRHLWSGLLRKGNRDDEGFKRIHPTQKPVGLFINILRDFTKANTLIIDAFGGSGSTLIACEKLGRRCFMMEIDPHYCDMIIRRWQNFTGQEAIREKDGIKFTLIEKERWNK